MQVRFAAATFRIAESVVKTDFLDAERLHNTVINSPDIQQGLKDLPDAVELEYTSRFVPADIEYGGYGETSIDISYNGVICTRVVRHGVDVKVPQTPWLAGKLGFKRIIRIPKPHHDLVMDAIRSAQSWFRRQGQEAAQQAELGRKLPELIAPIKPS